MNIENILQLLNNHVPFDSEEASFLEAIKTFIDCSEGVVGKSHITASGWLLDSSGNNACLLMHAKLNRWLQPGGHPESVDETIFDTALRETSEETEIHPGDLIYGKFFDVDVHPIPSRGDEPAHIHYDLRFLFMASEYASVKISKESTGYKFEPLTTLVNDNSASIRRMAKKTVNGQYKKFLDFDNALLKKTA